MLPKLKNYPKISIEALLVAMDCDPDYANRIIQVISTSFGEPRHQWNLNKAMFPDFLFMKDERTYLEFEWIPIYDEKNELTQIIIVFRDITKRTTIEQEAHQEMKKNALTLTLLKNFSETDQDLNHFLLRCDELLDQSAIKVDQGSHSELAPILHTLKGNARTLQFDQHWRYEAIISFRNSISRQ